MKILYCDTLRSDGLANESVHTYEIVKNLSELGHKVVLLNGALPRFENKFDFNKRSFYEELKVFLFQSPVTRPLSGVITLAGLFFLEFYIFFSTFLVLTKNEGRFDVIYRRHNLFSSEYILGKLFKIPTVREVNGIYTDELKIQKRGDWVTLWIIGKLERINMSKADKIITVTSRLKTTLQEEYGVSEMQITVIPNGANIDLFHPMDIHEVRTELEFNQNDIYICYVGKLIEWQGLEYLIMSMPRIVRIYPRSRLVVVGDGPMKQKLIDSAKQLNVSENFIFTGMIPYTKVPTYINACDICVVLGDHNFRNDRTGASPLKLHEYMACGKPVVASNLSGMREDIDEYKTGFSINSSNHDEIATAIILLIENEPLRSEMGKNGRQVVEEKYSWKKIAEQVAGVCKSLREK